MANSKKKKPSTKRKKKEDRAVEKLSSAEKREITLLIISIFAIAISIIAVFSMGPVGLNAKRLMVLLVGDLYIVFFLLFIVGGVYYIFRKRLPKLYIRKLIGVVIFAIALITFMAKLNANTTGFDVLKGFCSNWKEVYKETSPAGGGILGAFLYSFLSSLVADNGAVIIIIAMWTLSAILIIDWTKTIAKFKTFKEEVLGFDKDSKKVKKEKESETNKKKPELFSYSKNDHKSTIIDIFDAEYDVKETPIVIEEKPIVKLPVQEVVMEAEPVVEQPTIEQPTIEEVFEEEILADGEAKPYQLPTLRFLDSKPSKANGGKSAQQRANEEGQHVVDILKQFNVPCAFGNATIGPSVTRFEIIPEPGVRVNKIASLQDDIKMALAAKDVRIEAPIPGKNAVGIEIPNTENSVVKMHEMLSNIPPKYSDHKLVVALGKSIDGTPVYGELDKMPHLLVAGATGSGKSVCMNAIITSILMRCTPDDCKLVLIDPKRVEFTAYHHLPHLIAPVINDAKEASKALKVVVDMMDGRYELFADAGVRNISGYNEKVLNHEFPEDRKVLPYVVVIIDELADLMMVAAKDVEGSIQRITQLARAAGIHLIVATQRPSVDVITGIIKANIPSRIAFAVSSATDSRTILDHAGAERLLGHGDMLYVPMGESNPIRVQGCYVSDDEVARITDFVKKQAQPHYDEVFSGPRLQDLDYDQGGVKPTVDPLYEECKAYVIETQKASTSLLQRRFGLGYNRAARMIDQLEENCIIGPNNGSKPREVYVKKVGAESPSVEE